MNLKDLLDDNFIKAHSKEEIAKLLGVETPQDEMAWVKTAFYQMKIDIMDMKKAMFEMQREKVLFDDGGWLDIKDAATILRVSQRSVQNYIRDGRLGSSQFARKNYVKKSEIDRLLNNYYEK